MCFESYWQLFDFCFVAWMIWQIHVRNAYTNRMQVKFQKLQVKRRTKNRIERLHLCVWKVVDQKNTAIKVIGAAKRKVQDWNPNHHYQRQMFAHYTTIYDKWFTEFGPHEFGWVYTIWKPHLLCFPLNYWLRCLKINKSWVYFVWISFAFSKIIRVHLEKSHEKKNTVQTNGVGCCCLASIVSLCVQ